MKILLVSDKENDHIWDHFDPQRFKDVDLIIRVVICNQDIYHFWLQW